jgi:hypothetical protein
MKTFLKAFSQMYHEGELDAQEVKWCLEICDNERNKAQDTKNPVFDTSYGQIDSLASGQLYCVECDNKARIYCPECEDTLCELCFERLHAKGNRYRHIPNHIVPCVICHNLPARLQCTYTRGTYCMGCYTNKHAKTLPKFLDLKPLKIDYRTNGLRLNQGKHGSALEDHAPPPGMELEVQDAFSKPAPLESRLGEKWHAFFDLRGVKYYYNFETEESLRRPQDDKIMDEEAEDHERAEIRREILDHLATSRAGRHLEEWAEGTARAMPKKKHGPHGPHPHDH